MSDTLTKLAYQTFQQGKSYFGLAHKTLGYNLQNLLYPDSIRQTQPFGVELIALLQQKNAKLQETDWLDAERGVYPTSLLFDNPWEDFFRYYPVVLLDMPQMWEKLQSKKY
jgi:hypothetical protein